MEDEMNAKTGKCSLAMRWIANKIKKKFGIEVQPKLKEFQALNDGENSQVHIDLIVNLSTEDFEKILDKIWP